MSTLRTYFFIITLLGALLASGLTSCSSSKHVAEGSLLLDKVSIVVENDSAATAPMKGADFVNYVRQQPNHKIFWAWKMQLGVYNLSGSDTTKRINRWLRKIGEAPVIYDSVSSRNSVEQLRRALVNKGYMHADVDIASKLDFDKKRADIKYILKPGKPYVIKSIDYHFPDDAIGSILAADTSLFPIQRGDLLDRTLLESTRDYIQRKMRDNGYFAFGKELVTFTADTTADNRDVALSLNVSTPKADGSAAASILHPLETYSIRRVCVFTDYNNLDISDLRNSATSDTTIYRGIEIYSDKNPYLRPSVIYDNCYLRPGSTFSQTDVDKTYDAFSRLGILKFINVRFIPVGSEESGLLDEYILLTPDKSQSLALEVEGTNSEGDLGVAAALTYTHRNIGRGSETLIAKVRGAYEALDNKWDGLLHNRYLEVSADAGIDFPKFKFPFLRESFKRRVRASTIFNLTFNYQERPEYTRIIATAGWSYRWIERRTNNRHTYSPIDINYVYLPESTYDFIDQIAPDNPLLRYSYEDHFIMRMGYSFYHSNKLPESAVTGRRFQPDIYTFRLNAEVAGNVLFALSNIFDHRADFRTDPYKVFGIRYSQYAKVDFDFVYVHTFDRHQSLACRFGSGVIVPYGNSTIAPFEKRFYGGGANGVRGWSVRTLGPGSYPSSNTVTDFINQCGDIRLDISAEYRAKLFWVLELGIFIDAGNIWTIREYSTQPGGVFRFDTFYKQIAASYGAGLRFDFTYFLLRFDLGMKAHNPAMGQDPWPLLHPVWKRDATFHFSIGYPF